MKAIYVKEPGRLEIEEIPRPKIKKSTEALVRIRAAGICGSDIAIYHGTNPMVVYPRIIGHEMTGIVEAVGSSVSRVVPGDRVIVEQVVGCGSCYPCRIGRANVCSHLKVRGVTLDGGYQEYMVVEESALHKLPDHLELEEGILIEPMSIAFQVISRAEVNSQDSVLVYGSGAVGLSVIKALRLTGAKIIAADVTEEKLLEAKNCGADVTLRSDAPEFVQQVRQTANDGDGPSVAIETAGIPGALEEIVKVVCNAGRIITLGFSEKPGKISELQITSRELDIRGSRLQNHLFPQVIQAVSENKVCLDGMISHRFHFTQVKEAFALADQKDPSVKKIVLLFD